MVGVTIVPHVYKFNDQYLRYIGLSINRPLPSMFWQQSGYVIGHIWEACWHVNISVDLPPGNHYVVIGTSADQGFTQGISVTLKNSVGADVASHARDGISRTQYMYVGFTITSTGTITSVTAGMIAPGQTPPISGVGGGGSGGQTTGGGGGVGMDFGPLINQMMQNILPPMMNIMMMMVMIQMMTGIMTGIMSGL